MSRLFLNAPAILTAVSLAAAPVACAQTAIASGSETPMPLGHPNGIQPETTLSLSATAEVSRAPDLAVVTVGVDQDADSAARAMADNRKAMRDVFSVLESAGIAREDMQTSTLSLRPRYEYPDVDGERRRTLVGYTASNQVTVRVRQIEALGGVLDALVEAGANTIEGIRFALDDDGPARDEARRQAMSAAIARAELYADVAGYEVARIVTIDESFERDMPQPMAMMSRAMDAESAPTPVAAGEVGYTATVTVTFELTK